MVPPFPRGHEHDRHTQARLLFAPVLLAMLLVGKAGLDATPAAVLASAAAWLTVTALDQRTQVEGSP